ncbi:hypothetical protein DUI87_02954 [Hirundo rustica rustica]|uniref:RNase H type-1 domain-containing protein n=1 Tax=Hirundo rustica rustica TaxID=333673 RepID=A0A3M0L911_HIRRU|nr:hypothetical protein DUI87_02954 [Hirundo rustica rustica]
MKRKWKAAVWSPTRQVAQATEGEGGSSQLAELKAVQLALDIAEREKWPKLYLYTDSWMVANALWGWLEKWKKANWQRRGKPIWAVDEWKDIATQVEKLPVKVRHVDAHVPKSRAVLGDRGTLQLKCLRKEKIIQILLEAGFAIKKSKVKGPAQGIQFLGIKWKHGRCQIPTDVINKITAMSPPTNEKETQAFLGSIGFWRMHIPEYSQTVSPLYLVTRKKNTFQ